MLALVDAARVPLEGQRSAVLDIQSIASHDVARCSATLAALHQAQQQAMGGILTRDSRPIWSAEPARAWREALADRATRIIAGYRADLRSYVADPAEGMPLHLGLFVALAVVFLSARRRVRDATDGAPLESTAPAVLHRPFSAAAVIVLFVASSPNSSPAPATLRTLFELVAVVPVLRLTRPAVDPRLLPELYMLAILFAVDTVRQALAGAPVIEQAILIQEMLAGIALLGYSLTAGALKRAPGQSTTRLGGFRTIAVLLMLALAVALGAGVVGYMRLARLRWRRGFSAAALWR